MKRVSLIAASAAAALAYQAVQAQNTVDLTVTAEVIESCDVVGLEALAIDFGVLPAPNADGRLDESPYASTTFEVACSLPDTEVTFTADNGQNATDNFRLLQNTDFAETVSLRYGVYMEDDDNLPLNMDDAQYWGEIGSGHRTFQRTLGTEPEPVTIYARIGTNPTLDTADEANRWAPGTYTDTVTIGMHIN